MDKLFGENLLEEPFSLKFSQNLLDTGFVTENFQSIVQEINSKKKKNVNKEFDDNINGIPTERINILNWYSLLNRTSKSGNDLTISVRKNNIKVIISTLNELVLLI